MKASRWIVKAGWWTVKAGRWIVKAGDRLGEEQCVSNCCEDRLLSYMVVDKNGRVKAF